MPQTDPIPTTLIADGWPDYRLLDSGHGRRLEQLGRVRVIRPEPQAMWSPKLPEAEWDKADASFGPNEKSEEDAGNWRFRRDLPETWPVSYRDLRFYGRFTPFRHLGFFPEQMTQWDWVENCVSKAGNAPRVLNLFGYTGVISLMAARAGAKVTHVDASKKAITYARENQELAGLIQAPIRWILDDARKFIAREARRGSHYEGIILDPPKFGRGPKGEIWKVFEHLPLLLSECKAVLSDKPLFVILTAYAARLSPFSLHALLEEHIGKGRIECGEITLREESGNRLVSTALHARWTP
ncbi:class I SAM-dependent methyltransferase [Ferrovibrio sp.]|uniref:class I SAM-dependent methyltransferase n=1 Tax=Ferrovibrio sp. TaxID=1917215 RepID=UPI003D0F176E